MISLRYLGGLKNVHQAAMRDTMRGASVFGGGANPATDSLHLLCQGVLKDLHAPQFHGHYAGESSRSPMPLITPASGAKGDEFLPGIHLAFRSKSVDCAIVLACSQWSHKKSLRPTKKWPLAKIFWAHIPC